MKTVWAVTKLVVRESIRKRLWLLIGTCCAVILLVPFFLPSMGEGGTVQVAQSWLLTCITLFGVVAVLFISGTSLPEDFREGRLFLMFTKPVYRSTYLISKFLGFFVVFLIFISVVGGVGYVMLLFLDGRTNRDGLIARQKISSDEYGFDQTNDVQKPVFSGALATDQENTERVVVHASSTTSPVAYWTFERDPARTYKRPPEALIHVGGAGADDRFSFKVRFFVEVPVEVESEEDGQEPDIEWQRVQREIKTIQRNKLARFTVLPDRYSDSEMHSVFNEFPRFRVGISPVRHATRLSFHRNSIRITGPDESFLVNYIKALFMIFLLLLLLAAFLVAVTPVLSGSISICLALLFYMIGSMTSFYQDALSHTKSTLQVRMQEGASGSAHVANPDIPTWALQYSQFVVENLLAVIPNFEQFHQQVQLMEGWHIPMSTLYNGISVTLPSMILFLVVGAVLFQIREIST